VLLKCAANPTINVREALETDSGAYHTSDELFADLRLCYDSLLSTGDHWIANSKLLDLIRQARAGFVYG
jgi:phosphoenolpyruvate carboxylase